MPEKQYPRRRDVREMLNQLCADLNERHDGTDFDRDFLNDVRDIMRDGFDFMGAVGIALDEDEPDDGTLYAIETAVAEAFDHVN